MQIGKVRLRGLIGLHRGMGLNELEFDLSNMRGVCAFVGPSGSGKSTVLESLTPWRYFPSRKIGLKDGMRIRDSYKDLTFAYNGHTYRALVTVDAHTGKSDGYLWKDANTQNDTPLTTGKVSEYDDALTALLGPQEFYFHSAFAPQSGESMLSLKPSARKDFFVEFLGLMRLAEYSEKAKIRSMTIQGTIDSYRRTEMRLLSEISDVPTWEDQISMYRASEAKHRQELDKLVREYDLHDVFMRSLELRQQEQSGLQRELAKLRQQATDLKNSTDTRRFRIEQEIGRLKDLIQNENRALDTDRKRLDSLQHLPETQNVDQIEADLIKVNAEIQKQSEIQLQYTKLEAERSRALDAIQARIDATKNLTALAERIPSNADRAICGQCGLAVASFKAIRELSFHQANLDQEKAHYAPRIDALMRQMNGSGLTPRRNELTKMLDSARNTEKQRAQREPLRLSITHREALIKGWTTQIQQSQASLKEIELDRVAAFAKLQSEIDAVVAKTDTTILIQIQAAAAKKTEMSRAMDGVRGELQTAESSQAILKDRITRSQKAQAELTQLRANLIIMDRDRAEWVLLQQICGRDKLQALELDAAAPAITDYSNQLLSECFGGRFNIRFETMDDAGREVFDIRVRDNKDGGIEESLYLKSGGEKQIVLHALRMAITLYSKERSGRDFRTLFMDESESSIDPALRTEFVGMMRSAMRTGGFETCLLVTHSMEIADAADRVIHFDPVAGTIDF